MGKTVTTAGGSSYTIDPKTGLPEFGSATPAANQDPTNIWFAQLPTMLQEVPKLWYNINAASQGHQETVPNAPVDYTGSGDISALNSQVPPGTTTKTVGAHPSSDHYLAPADILNQVAAMQYNKPQDLMAIQALMANGTWGTVNVNGVFDSHTQNALINAMERYYTTTKGTGAAMSFMDYLKSAGTRAAIAQQQKLAGSSTPQVHLQDPATIAQLVQSTAQAALGQNLTQEQIDKFVSEFQARQQAAQLSQNPTVTSPDLGSEAMAFVQNSNPGAYQANQRTQYEDALVNMLGGNRPTVSNADLTPSVRGTK